MSGSKKGERQGETTKLFFNHVCEGGKQSSQWTSSLPDEAPTAGNRLTLSSGEVAERLNKLQKRGWKPRRSIILCNWDAEEYGLLGSTEWVEDNRELLASRAVAYLNVDSAVSGHGFHAMATPQLDELLKEAAKKVQDPDNSSQTVFESWVLSDSPLIGRLGGGGTDLQLLFNMLASPQLKCHLEKVTLFTTPCMKTSYGCKTMGIHCFIGMLQLQAFGDWLP